MIDHKAAALLAGVTERTIRQWVRDGKLASRNGRISIRDLEAWKIKRSETDRRRGARPPGLDTVFR